ncbi:MAG: DUF6497 family protein [Shimia sp.]
MLLLCATTQPAGAEEAPDFGLPSGLPATFQESFFEDRGDGRTIVRFRFVVPEIGTDAIGYGDVADDFLHLCDAHVLPALGAMEGVSPDEIVISLADRPVPFGRPAPEATQFFEAFGIQDGACIWDAF